MGTASLILSIIGAVFSLIGLIPFLGSLNWLALTLLLIAFILGLITVLTKEKKGTGIAGLITSIIFGIIAMIRLFLGGGII